jgi:hypothetical protein
MEINNKQVNPNAESYSCSTTCKAEGTSSPRPQILLSTFETKESTIMLPTEEGRKEGRKKERKKETNKRINNQAQN